MPRNILMIEDDENNALLVKRVLEAQAFQVIHASDGESGLQMAMEAKPDLILLDLGLPDVDGQTVAAFLKRLPELAKTPIIALTAWPEDTARKMAAAYGCNGYIAKPINTRTFAAEVSAYLPIKTD
jgi:two-component system cell cycle response regulator DivK